MKYRDWLVSGRRRQWHPTPVLLPGKSHGWRRLVGCSPWDRKESDTTERLHVHFSLSTFMLWRRKWQPTPVFLPWEPQGWGSLVGCRLRGRSHRVGHDWSDLAAAASPSVLLQMSLFHYFLWLSNIPIYILFIHSSVDGHLHCFHALAIEVVV